MDFNFTYRVCLSSFISSPVPYAEFIIVIVCDSSVIKSRLQGAPEGTYKGIVDCAMKTVKADGAGALFKGLGPAMARAFPANAACFVSFLSFFLFSR